MDRLAPSRSATRPAARQRPRPDVENSGGEVSCCPRRAVLQQISSALQAPREPLLPARLPNAEAVTDVRMTCRRSGVARQILYRIDARLFAGRPTRRSRSLPES